MRIPTMQLAFSIFENALSTKVGNLLPVLVFDFGRLRAVIRSIAPMTEGGSMLGWWSHALLRDLGLRVLVVGFCFCYIRALLMEISARSEHPHMKIPVSIHSIYLLSRRENCGNVSCPEQWLNSCKMNAERKQLWFVWPIDDLFWQLSGSFVS